MTYENIKLDIAEQIATITLNKPERLNACSLDMADDIFIALDKLEDARAVIITGEGRAFCAGADLQAKNDSALSGGQGSYAALNQHYNPLMVKLAKLDIPTITAVNGPAAGVGCSIALASDFAIAGKSAYFLQAFVNIGLVPDGGASWMLTRLVGKARATEMMMLGEKIPGEKAAEWGLVYKCVEDDALMGEAQALAKRLANGPTVALGVMRQNLAAALESDYATALLKEAEGQRKAGDSNDAREGAIAFLQKRKAEFKGK
ncbi:enoyl-CoA hydratase-related protein [Parasphingorhabdus halotolerans]|uniref:2-(1,2-epoxy-1,2-dihydrophenyl)acetyl-CoA isomerase n=1 Tax=Parasphingorhabdus halotolerans TaxID=2725558 RepID=A0A6H2DJX1_9SPHN|nr:enoyl-CoA hydratase-related protein [Parasphingorhabdus halotolerans]QJB68283.1 2-(1,2-epoxy-1,2-dihydrophenyl)acetyl-CoA isomerase [Parasphingorhabdus halotolerans]